MQHHNGSIFVNVGSADHPMLPEHYIEWIYVQTENGGQRIVLKPGDEPNATFSLEDGKAAASDYFMRCKGSHFLCSVF